MRNFTLAVAKRVVLSAPGLLVFICCASSVLSAAELKPETIKAWDRYIQTVQTTIQERLSANRFLWIDDQADGRVAIARGDLKVAPALARGSEPLAGGLVHHWVGAAFIPHATLEEVIKVTRDYSHYKEYFNPEVRESRSLGQSGDDDRFSIRWATKVLFVSAGIDTECISRNVRIDDKRFYQTSATIKVQEIENYGKQNERQLAPDQGDGFVWRLFTITRYAAESGGVILELEALALTRDIPGSLRVLIAPVVRRTSANSLLLSLRQTRDAVLSNKSSVALAHSAPVERSSDLLRGN